MRMTTVLAALGLMALAGGAMAQTDVIAERRAGLKRMGGHMEAIKPVVEAKGDVRALEPRIDDMIAWYRGMPALFPPGSGTGDTKALPAIWTDFGKFQETEHRPARPARHAEDDGRRRRHRRLCRRLCRDRAEILRRLPPALPGALTGRRGWAFSPAATRRRPPAPPPRAAPPPGSASRAVALASRRAGISSLSTSAAAGRAA